MTRREEALAYIPAPLAGAAQLVPGAPLDAEEGEGGWVEAQLQLLDYIQVGSRASGQVVESPLHWWLPLQKGWQAVGETRGPGLCLASA